MSNVQAQEVTKSFGEGDAEHQVLGGVDLTIDDGELVAIMGPSGSGKSTLLYALSGMDDVTSGIVTIDGTDITALKQAQLAELRLSKMGFVFQQMHMLRNLAILDNILLPGFEAATESRDVLVERARGLMNRVGIDGTQDRQITEVSGGQLQRAAICRALINEPGIIFCDEPTGSLNASSAEEIMNILAEVNASGTTVVIVTHDAHVAARCERVVMLRDGRIVDERSIGAYPDDPAERRDRLSALTGWLASHGI